MTTSEFSDGAQPIDRRGEQPLWAQLEVELRRRLEAGDFNLRFPTDREIMAIYEVSRHTARHAISELGSSGLLRRTRGIGTSVDARNFERSLGSLYSLFQVVEERGITQQSEVRQLGRVIDADAAEQLGLAHDAELVLLDRVRFAAGEPLAVDRIWVPAHLGEPLLDVDFARTSLYNELERTAGFRPNAGWERINPAIPSDDERSALALADGEAIFAIERLGTYQGTPVEWRTTCIRGDRFTLVADWSAGQRNELRPEMKIG